jgi:DNA-binding PadR family transcriptional regulator
MSATRLLVLGAIRILAPVHGYDVRRELLTWHLEELTNIKPGSIYSALRTLEKDGCIAVHAREGGDNRPERTMYVITGEGEKEFQVLLRETWWTVRNATEPLIPALCLMPFLPRDELIGALQARLGTLRGQLDSMSFFRRTVRDGATGADGEVPEHVREIIDFVMTKQRAEIDWTRAFVKRLQEGKYAFVGEPGFPIEGLNQT